MNRQRSVKCISQTASCLFLPKAKFIRGVIKFKLIEIVDREYKER